MQRGRWLKLGRSAINRQTLALFLQGVLFGFAFHLNATLVWQGVFVVAALINLWAWLWALSWRRAIVDTPTSRIVSAAQGYTELIGVGQYLAASPLFTPFSHLPCLWYRYTLEERKNGEWQHVEQDESEARFILADASGRCEIDPVGAEILTTHKETRTQGDQRYTEYLLLQGDRLYALGDFVSLNGSHTALNVRRDVGDLLAEWKADQAALHARFDLDQSGVIDDQEWQLARNAAQREVERQHQDIRKQPTQHYLRKPASRRPYLIANHAPEKLGQRYAWLAAAYLFLLLGCLVGIAWAMRLPG